MNRKGFTLIELLVTIALLSIIVTISYVSINRVIEQSKVNDCNSIAGNIKSAVSEYVSDNRYNNAFVNSVDISDVENYNVNIDGRVLKNYLSNNITNPFDKDDVITLDELEKIKINVELNKNYTVKNVNILEPTFLIECKE